MSFIANWSFPTEVRFGESRIFEIREACNSIGINRPLIVTDRNLVKLKFIKEIRLSVEEEFSCEIFHSVDANPTEMNLYQGIDKFKLGNHDGILAIGGGSAIDLGKLIAFMVHQSLDVWDFDSIT